METVWIEFRNLCCLEITWFVTVLELFRVAIEMNLTRGRRESRSATVEP